IIHLLRLAPPSKPGLDPLIAEGCHHPGNRCIARERKPVDRLNWPIQSRPWETECLGQGKGADRAVECPGDSGRMERNRKPRRPLLTGDLEASGPFRDTVLVKDRIDRHWLFLLPLVPGTACQEKLIDI